MQQAPQMTPCGGYHFINIHESFLKHIYKVIYAMHLNNIHDVWRIP